MNEKKESKEPSSTPSSTQFLKTDRGKTKSNAIEIPSIALPKGGGAIKSVDEKFSVNAVNGTASFSIPLPFSPARGTSPSLNLSYNSGSGNSIFGLGWTLSLPSIKRKTDKELPQYLDAIDSDTYLFSEAEDLVPEFKKEISSPGANEVFSKDEDENYIIKETDSPDRKFKIRFYKPRTEGLFARIERWTEKSNSSIKWRVITKENTTTLFGWSNASRIYDPSDANKIFEWLPEFVYDDKGNCSHYIYKKEDNLGCDPTLLHNRNRLENGNITYTNLYLEKVLYGNKKPYLGFNEPFLSESDYFFQTVFDYGEYDINAPFNKIENAKVNNWNYRKDAFSEYKAGFEIRTTRLCQRVLLFHCFEELPGSFALVKSTDFDYETNVKDKESFTFLKGITSRGYIKLSNGTYSTKSLPPMEFDYQEHEWNSDLKSITIEDLTNAPVGLDEAQYQFTDLFNEGLSGILTEQGDGWYYKHNLGNGKFEQAKLVSPKPSFSGLGQSLQLLDLDADGGKQLVNLNTQPKGYFELNDDNQWQRFQPFKNLPNIDMKDPNTRLIDLNGDGKPEIVITEDQLFTWYESEGREGFSEAYQTPKPLDEEKGPHIVFSDPKQTIYLADMSGDGLIDIVRIRNGEICYWPNLGYGKFGKKVAMDNAPVFDYPDTFNPAYLRLADIDGSGTSDIIYLGKNKFTCWMNLNGNTFTTSPFEIEAFPQISNQSKITVTDLLGNGIACIVSSSSLPKDARSPLKYIDLMNSKKPHIMISYKNNLGKEVNLEYTPSTKYYIDDKLAGRPWVTKLHFPVHCISKTETKDTITGHRFISSYTYHHGYYDHPEREFRGFGMVEQHDTEYFDHWIKGNGSNIVDQTLHQAPALTRSWFHTGAFISKEKILNQFAHEYWNEEMTKKGIKVENNDIPWVNKEAPLPDAKLIAAPGLNPAIIDKLTPEEWQEALRACKSMPLRTEIFAKDAPLTGATSDQLKKELTPFTVATHNCIIECVQPKGQNKYAIFIVKESEAITYNYERNTEDPRIAHNLNIKLDQYGNVLESASVVYPRLQKDSTLPAETQAAQNQTTIIYTQNQFTKDVNETNAYRLRLPSEVKTFELKVVSKTDGIYSLSDLKVILSKAKEVLYHEVNVEPEVDTPRKRLIEHIRSVFYKNDLSGPLPLHKLESLALPYENYQLAYTPELLTDIYENRVNDPLMEDGKFTHSEGDKNWWIRSGTTQFIEESESVANARNRFFSPISYIDPYGAKTKVKYYSNYYLYISEIEDAIGNKTYVEQFNFRTLSPQRMRDPNNNISEAITDELGLIKAIAVFGKGHEADDLEGLTEFTLSGESDLIGNFFNHSNSNDPMSTQLIDIGNQLLQHATARFIYDFDTYKTTGKPVVVASILREEHVKKNNNSPIQLSFEYSNGFGKVVMKKVQAEPGPAKQVVFNPINPRNDTAYSISEIDTASLSPKRLRWIGNGRTILNNKGNPVKQYEPYFSVTPKYEDLKELVETGVTPILYYDALGRLIKTENPDGTFSKTEFDSWKQIIYDANDTVKDSLWYTKRNALPSNNLERIAAEKALAHYDTPTQLHFDTLARPILQIENNGKDDPLKDILYKTRVELDIEGNLRSVVDDRGNTVMTYKYDMLGNKVYQDSMDAGKRWLLVNIIGNPLRTWDERQYEFQYSYDILHRPIQSKVKNGDGDELLDHIFERIVYGESEQNPESKNIRGQIVKHYDTGGLIETPEYDFKGQPKTTTRKLYKNYKGDTVPNWIDANLVTDLETENPGTEYSPVIQFTFSTETDALGRVTRQIAPDGSIITPSYNEAGLLNGETVVHIDPAMTTTYIKNIDYNEKGQRSKIEYGNDVVTKFFYDKETFRLNHLESRKHQNVLLQDLYYIFDPVGNITHIEDKSIPDVFFNNQKFGGISSYTYDPLYRLKVAEGRENTVSPSYNGKDNWDDAPFKKEMNPNDAQVMRTYTQHYWYDRVGNILEMRHISENNNWTRKYAYEALNNRLIRTEVGTQKYNYPHHPKHGFITQMPHLEDMGWNFKEELVKTVRQRRTDGGVPETTYYQYDGQGQRLRKITENTAGPGEKPTLKEERIYISGYELYKQHSGEKAGLERRTLSLMDKEHRFVMIETRNGINDDTENHLVRYQLDNHLGSVSLELDADAVVISYEEYHPYGTTAFQAKNTEIKSAAKRYRYTGMERDEESGLAYHSARYYMPWLGRWLSADPKGLSAGINGYTYVKNKPVMAIDPSGMQASLPDEASKLPNRTRKVDTPPPSQAKPVAPKPTQPEPVQPKSATVKTEASSSASQKLPQAQTPKSPQTTTALTLQILDRRLEEIKEKLANLKPGSYNPRLPNFSTQLYPSAPPPAQTPSTPPTSTPTQTSNKAYFLIPYFETIFLSDPTPIGSLYPDPNRVSDDDFQLKETTQTHTLLGGENSGIQVSLRGGILYKKSVAICLVTEAQYGTDKEINWGFGFVLFIPLKPNKVTKKSLFE